MSWVGVAIGGASLIGGVIQGSAAKSAANTQAGAAENAAATQERMFNTMYQGQTPYMQSGYGAMSNLDYLMGITPMTAQGGQPGDGAVGTGYNQPANPQYQQYTAGPNGSMRPMVNGGPPGRGDMRGIGPNVPGGRYTAPLSQPAGAQMGGPGYGSLLTPFSADMMREYSPAYQYQLQQGEQGVLNGASANGQGALSGAAQMGLQQNNQALANTAFNNAFNQYQTQQGNIYQRLAAIAQLGQGAASNQATGASTFAGGIGQAQAAVGSYLGAGQIGAANAYSGALNNAMPWLYQGMQGMGGGVSNNSPGNAEG